MTIQPLRWLKLELTIFEAETYDLIELSVLDFHSDQFQNIERARQAGIEMGLKLIPTRWLDIQLAYNYLYARELKETGTQTPLSYFPEHLALIILSIRPHKIIKLKTNIRLVGP